MAQLYRRKFLAIPLLLPLFLALSVRAQQVIDGPTENNLTNALVPPKNTLQPADVGEECTTDGECQLLNPFTICNTQKKCGCRATYILISGLCRPRQTLGTHALARASATHLRVVLSQSQKTAIICATAAAVGGGLLVLFVVLINKRKRSSPEQRKKRWVLEHITVTPPAKY